MQEVGRADRGAGVKALGAACGVGLLAMLGMFVVSSLEMSLGAGLARVADTRWGMTTLADLGVGLLLVIGWIWLVEARTPRRVAWTLLILGTGNFGTLVFVMTRCFRARSLREVVMRSQDGNGPR